MAEETDEKRKTPFLLNRGGVATYSIWLHKDWIFMLSKGFSFLKITTPNLDGDKYLENAHVLKTKTFGSDLTELFNFQRMAISLYTSLFQLAIASTQTKSFYLF